MTALIHKQTPEIWGKVVITPSGWSISLSDRPTLFSDEITIEGIESLSCGNPLLKEFELVWVKIELA